MSALRKEWHSGPVFIIGPPVQSQGLQRVVEQVLECVVDDYVTDFSLDAILGPVTFKRSWLPGGRASKRAGLDGCDLYCANAWWRSEEDPPESFTVAVMDKSCYDGHAEDRGDKIPEFETFLVSMFRGEAVKSDRVFQWMTYRMHNWYDRSEWAPIWNLEQSERDHAKTVHWLKGGGWRDRSLLHL